MQLLERLHVSRAVAYSLLGRGWTLISGPITMLLVASHLSAETQGFYYTFGSIVALKAFFELGLTSVIVNNVSHEWAHLRLGEGRCIEGEERALGRLVCIGRFVFAWYAVVAFAFTLVVGFVGWRFFSVRHVVPVAWEGPWIGVVVISGLQFLTLPALAILEGCNQVSQLSLYRLAQGIITSGLVWLGLLAGWELWVLVLLGLAALVADGLFVTVRYRRFFATFWTRAPDSTFNWRTEVWPMQWRMGFQGLVSYFAFNLSNPVVFHYAGPAEAGRLGMALSLTNSLSTSALVWLQVNVPSFGVLVAKRDFATLDRRVWRLFVVSGLVLLCGASALFALVWILRHAGHPLGFRVCGPLPFALLLVNSVLMHLSQAQSMYLRAHRREPWLQLGVVASLLTGLLVWWWGRNFGVTGAVAGQLAVTALLVIPVGTWIFIKKRVEWRQTLLVATP